ncbi:hypothetical protein P7C73_g429, partial [Tremellales sp. Uapishka_1]
PIATGTKLRDLLGTDEAHSSIVPGPLLSHPLKETEPSVVSSHPNAVEATANTATVTTGVTTGIREATPKWKRYVLFGILLALELGGLAGTLVVYWWEVGREKGANVMMIYFIVVLIVAQIAILLRGRAERARSEAEGKRERAEAARKERRSRWEENRDLARESDQDVAFIEDRERMEEEREEDKKAEEMEQRDRAWEKKEERENKLPESCEDSVLYALPWVGAVAVTAAFLKF